MDFKELVMQGADDKYKNMLSDTTPKPFGKSTSIQSFGEYDRKRKNYENRLASERQQCSNAIIQVRDAYITGNDDKAHDRKKLRRCTVSLIIGAVILLAFAFIAIPNGATIWAKEVFVVESSFEYFFSLLSILFGGGNAGFEVSILALIMTAAAWLIVFIVSDEKGTIAGAFLGGLVFVGASVIIPFLIFRLLLVGLSWVVYYLVTPSGMLMMGLAILILIIIFGCKVRLKKSKARVFVCAVVLIFTTLISAFFGNINMEAAQIDYMIHNGHSIETPMIMKENKSYTVYLRHGENEVTEHYFEFEPEEDGLYTFTSSASKGEYRGEVYEKKINITSGVDLFGGIFSDNSSSDENTTSNLSLVGRSEENDLKEGDFEFSCHLEEGKTYYFKVCSNERDWDDSHLRVKVTK